MKIRLALKLIFESEIETEGSVNIELEREKITIK